MDNRQRRELARYQAAAAARGGRCLSRRYVNNNTKLTFECAEGHRWSMLPRGGGGRSWCPRCAHARIRRQRMDRTLAQLRDLAARHGGKCLSRRYEVAHAKLEFRCEEGHRFSAVASSVQQGHWCPECPVMRMRQEQFLAVQAMARKRGGRCLATTYLNVGTKMRWRCAEGHEWVNTALGVHKGIWCPRCAEAERQRVREQKRARRLRDAKKRGIVASDRRRDLPRVLLRCERGHEWSVPAREAGRHGCRWCASHQNQEGKRRKKFASVLRIAARHGGTCLSRDYVDQTAPMRWRCARGHEWEANAMSIGQGYWCQACKRGEVARERLAILQKLARRRGGECLSDEYVDSQHPMTWRCAAGHRWRVSANHVTGGTWCPQCRGAPFGTLDRLREIARRHGGLCLSRRYVSSDTHLLWRCREGHEWYAKPIAIVRGRWCRICRTGGAGDHPRQRTLEEMQAMAAERGGQFVSTSYFNMLTPHRWRCARGHEWEARPNGVQRGSWCALCARSFVGTIDGLRAHALGRGGRCLSTKYDDPRVPLRWECAKGHRFEALIAAIKGGLWCPRCEPWPGSRRAAAASRG